MKEHLTFIGQDAIAMGAASHRQPEVLRGGGWCTVSALPEASRQCAIDPTTVRLVAPTRVLVEDILKIGLQPGTDVNAAIQAARLNTRKPLTVTQIKALDLIQKETAA